MRKTKTDDEFLAEINPKYLRLSPENQQLVKIRVKALIDNLLADQERPTITATDDSVESDLDAIRRRSNEVFTEIDKMKGTDD